MRVFRSYHCDLGHRWIVERQDYEAEQHADSICPEGHPAITCQVEFPVEDFQVLISPAARVADQRKEQRILDGRYYLSLLDKTGTEVRASKMHYDWDAVVKLATFFKGKSVEQALIWWARRDP
jgi:hypothetical protein